MQATSALKMYVCFVVKGPGSRYWNRYCEEYDKNAISPLTPGTASLAIHGLSYFDMSVKQMMKKTGTMDVEQKRFGN
jgi:hypothetical protein